MRWFVVLALLSGTAAAAQTPAEVLYFAEQYRSPAAAAGLELVLPVLGYGYAGSPARGLLPLAATIAGAVLTAGADDARDAQFGGMIILFSRAWGAMEAASVARRRNEELRAWFSSLNDAAADRAPPVGSPVRVAAGALVCERLDAFRKPGIPRGCIQLDLPATMIVRSVFGGFLSVEQAGVRYWVRIENVR